jgi:Spy/CpxP family protein refolding chaperone
MGRDRLKIALVVSLAFNLAVISAFVYGFARKGAPDDFSRPRAGAGPNASAGECCRFARQMGLPRARAARFSQLMTARSKEMVELRGRLQRARRELVELIDVQPPDEQRIRAKVDEISAIQGEIEKRLVTRLLSVNRILQPEERQRFMHLIRGRCMPCPNEVPNAPERARQESEVGR